MPSTPSVSAASACTRSQGPSAEPEPEQELDVATAAAAAAHRDRRLAAGQQQTRRTARLSALEHAAHLRRHVAADLARLAFEAIRQDHGLHALPRRNACGRLERRLRCGDDPKLRACQSRIARLDRLPCPALQRRSRRGGDLDAVTRQHRKGIRAGGRIGHGGTGGNVRRVVARHVRDGERHEARRVAGDAEAPALDAREVAAHGVDLADRRTRAQQRARERLLVLEGQPLGGQRQQRRSAARHAGTARGRRAPSPCTRSNSALGRTSARRRPARDARTRAPRCARRPPRGRAA